MQTEYYWQIRESLLKRKFYLLLVDRKKGENSQVDTVRVSKDDLRSTSPHYGKKKSTSTEGKNIGGFTSVYVLEFLCVMDELRSTTLWFLKRSPTKP